MKQILKYLFLLLIGGGIYYLLEIIFRGYSSLAMIFVGGLCFLICGLLNEVTSWRTPLLVQMLVCTAAITAIEFVAGMVLNVWLKLGLWDYSGMPFNLRGQICLPFSALWFFLSFVGIVLDDWIRYRLFGEEKPHYILWGTIKIPNKKLKK